MFIYTQAQGGGAINTDRINYMLIKEHAGSGYTLQAYLDGQELPLMITYSRDLKEVQARLDSIIDDLNEHSQRIRIVDGQVDTYPHE